MKKISDEELTLLILENKIDNEFKTTLSKDYVLSEEMIEKFKNYINWNVIFKHQSLSNEFKAKHEKDFIKDLKCKLDNDMIQLTNMLGVGLNSETAKILNCAYAKQVLEKNKQLYL